MRLAPFSPRVEFAVAGACGVLGPTDTAQLRVVGAEGEVGTLTLPLSPRVATTADWHGVRDRLLAVVPEVSRPQVEPLLDRLERPDSVPAFGRILLDETGLVWVQAWGPEFGFHADWSVHDGRGRRVARISFDRPARLLHVSGNVAIGVLLDDFDRQVLSAWRVNREGDVLGLSCA